MFILGRCVPRTCFPRLSLRVTSQGVTNLPSGTRSREKAEKKEQAKAEKENMKKSKPGGVRKTVDKTAQPKRRGRPPKNPPVASVPPEGESAVEIELKNEKTPNPKKKRDRQQSVSTTPVPSPPRKTQATSAMEDEPVVDTGAASTSHDTKTDNHSHPTGKSPALTPSQTSLPKPRRSRKTATKAPEHMVDDKPNALDKDPASAEAVQTTKNQPKGASKRVRKPSSKPAVAPDDKQVDMEKPKNPGRRTTSKKEPTPKPAGGDVEEGKVEVKNRARRAKKTDQQPAKNDQQSSGSKPSGEEPATQLARRRPPRLPTKSISLKTEILTYDAVVAKCVELYKECPKVHCSCNNEPICHKGECIPQFEDDAPCRLSIYWKTDAVGLKVQDFTANDGKTWKWTQSFYFATPGMCIQSAIFCMTQFASWRLN